MFDAYIETLKTWYDITDESTYDMILGDFIELAHICGESVTDFIVNVAMHPDKWPQSSQIAIANATRGHRV